MRWSTANKRRRWKNAWKQFEGSKRAREIEEMFDLLREHTAMLFRLASEPVARRMKAGLN